MIVGPCDSSGLVSPNRVSVLSIVYLIRAVRFARYIPLGVPVDERLELAYGFRTCQRKNLQMV